MKNFLAIFILCLSIFAINVENAEAGRSKADTNRALGFERYYGLLHDQEMQKRIDGIGQRLIAANNLSPDDFSFKVINSGEINAVTLPGGYIYVFKGLIDFMPTDEELAGVIGHEMGHVMGNHLARREREQLLTTIIGSILAGPEGAIAANAALASLPAYGQRDEREADDSGFEYMVKAKMNPYALLVVMNKLGDTETSGIRSNFAQHPEPATRAERIRKYVEQMDIEPKVIESGSSAIVKDGTWEFIIGQPDGPNKPLYRAWLLAGNLYTITLSETPVADKFIVVEEQNQAQIYYGENLIYTIGAMDTLKDGETFSNKAAIYVESLRTWANSKKPATTNEGQ